MYFYIAPPTYEESFFGCNSDIAGEDGDKSYSNDDRVNNFKPRYLSYRSTTLIEFPVP